MQNKFNVKILLIIIIILLIIGLVYLLNKTNQLSNLNIPNKVTNNETNKPIELVKKEGNKLIFQLDNGKETILQDVLGETDITPSTGPTENHSRDSRFYKYDKLYEDINHYGVYVGYYVGMDNSSYYLLINKKNGNQVSLPSRNIVISPDKQKIVSYNLDIQSGFTVNGFSILNLRGENFYIEFELDPSGWGPSNAKWINNTELEFEKTILDDNHNEEIAGSVKFKLLNNKWTEVK